MEVESEEEVNFAERAEVAVDPPRRLWRSHCVSSAEVRLLARRRGMINPDEDDEEDEDEDVEEENKLEDEVVVVPVEPRVLGALAPNRSPSGVSSRHRNRVPWTEGHVRCIYKERKKHIKAVESVMRLSLHVCTFQMSCGDVILLVFPANGRK